MKISFIIEQFKLTDKQKQAGLHNSPQLIVTSSSYSVWLDESRAMSAIQSYIEEINQAA